MFTLQSCDDFYKGTSPLVKGIIPGFGIYIGIKKTSLCESI